MILQMIIVWFATMDFMLILQIGNVFNVLLTTVKYAAIEFVLSVWWDINWPRMEPNVWIMCVRVT